MKIKSAKLLEPSASVSVSIAPAGNLPLTQSYNEATGEYDLDRTMMPLILTPSVFADNKDVSDQTPDSKSWWILEESGNWRMIESTADSTRFELYPAGYPMGIKVKVNSTPDKPIKLRFDVTVSGVRTMEEIALRCESEAAPAPMLELDYPASSAWNPFETGHDKITITPNIRAFGQTGYSVGWMKQDGSTKRAIDPSDPKDAELELNTATNALTIDRRWMGDSITLFCQLKKGSKVIREMPVTIVRRIPEFIEDYICPHQFEESTKSIRAEAYYRIPSTGRIADPSKELIISWYDNKLTVVGTGNSHTYPVTGDNVSIAADFKDRGCLKLFTVNGAYLTVGGVLIGGR